MEQGVSQVELKPYDMNAMNTIINHIPNDWDPSCDWSFTKWYCKLKEEYPMPVLINN